MEIVADEYEPEVVQLDDGFDDALADASQNFDVSLKSKLSPGSYTKLRTIGAFIMRGLTLEESCILSRVSKEKLDELVKENDDVRNFIIFKQISFKAGLLNTLTDSAISGKQSKNAGWLLEKKFAREYDPKKSDDDSREPDVVERAIQYVRANSDSNPLVKKLPMAHG